MPDAPKVASITRTFALLVCAAFLGAILSQGVSFLMIPDDDEVEPVVPQGFDPTNVKPKMGQ